MISEPRSYICRSCNVVYATLPADSDGHCPNCMKVLSLNPYMGLAQLGIDYFSYSGPGGWSPVEVLRIARSMVFILEKRLAEQPMVDEPRPLERLIGRALEGKEVNATTL